MSVLDNLKNRLAIARKEKNNFELALLQTILGEVSQIQAKKNVTDTDIHSIIKKIMKSNEESRTALSSFDDPRSLMGQAQLDMENRVLLEFLPINLSLDEVREYVQEVADEIKAAKSEGQAIGIAMKYFKVKGLNVEGSDVKIAVQELRA